MIFENVKIYEVGKKNGDHWESHKNEEILSCEFTEVLSNPGRVSKTESHYKGHIDDARKEHDGCGVILSHQLFV